jgi:hypothetical protein
MYSIFFIIWLAFSFSKIKDITCMNQQDNTTSWATCSELKEEPESISYDCSNRALKANDLKNLAESIQASQSLNLANNVLGEIIKNGTFSYFNSISEVFNLSDNKISHIESYGFFYHSSMNESDSALKANEDWRPLRMKILDLSYNKLEEVPLDAIKNLAHLETLMLNWNPIKKLDDKNILPEDHSKYFINIIDLHLSSCEIESISNDFFKLFRKLSILDLSNNQIKYFDYGIGHFLVYMLNVQNLNVKNNSLVCDCRLLWLKKFLSKSSENKSDQNSKTTCIINSSLLETHSAKNSSHKEYQTVPLVDLPNNLFICQIEMSLAFDKASVQYETSNQVIHINLECIVNAHPIPFVWWTLARSDQIIDVTLGNANDYEFKERTEVLKRSLLDSGIYADDPSYFYTVRSIATIKIKNIKKNISFECRAGFYNFSYKIVEHISAVINIGLPIFEEEVEDQTKSIAVTQDYKQKIENKHDAILFWLLLVVCSLISILVVALIATTIIHTEKKKLHKDNNYNAEYAFNQIKHDQSEEHKEKNKATPSEESVELFEESMKEYQDVRFDEFAKQ